MKTDVTDYCFLLSALAIFSGCWYQFGLGIALIAIGALCFISLLVIIIFARNPRKK